MKACGQGAVLTHLFLISVLNDVDAQTYAPASVTHWRGGWMMHRAVRDILEKIFFPGRKLTTIRHHLVMKTARNPTFPTNTLQLGNVGHQTHCTKYTPESIVWLASPEHCYW